MTNTSALIKNRIHFSMANCPRQRIVLLLVLSVLLTATTITTQGRYTIKATADGVVEDQAILNEIPKVSGIYQGKEYATLMPYFMKDGQSSVELGFPIYQTIFNLK